jgi:hypothetical protein
MSSFKQPQRVRKILEPRLHVARARKEKVVLDDQVCELERRISDLERKKTATQRSIVDQGRTPQGYGRTRTDYE